MKNCTTSMLWNLSIKEIEVRQYPYRSANLKNVICEIERDEKLEGFLSQKSGKAIDNHTLYQVSYKDGSSFGIMCSDLSMRIGLIVEENCW